MNKSLLQGLQMQANQILTAFGGAPSGMTDELKNRLQSTPDALYKIDLENSILSTRDGSAFAMYNVVFQPANNGEAFTVRLPGLDTLTAVLKHEKGVKIGIKPYEVDNNGTKEERFSAYVKNPVSGTADEYNQAFTILNEIETAVPA